MKLTELHFDNASLHALPVETVSEDSRQVEPQRHVKGACWSPIKPEPVKSPVLVAASLPCLALLDLEAIQVRVVVACLLGAAMQDSIVAWLQCHAIVHRCHPGSHYCKV